MAKTIGITGGIGVGKTTVCQIFKTLGIPVFNADDTAKQIVNTNLILKENIIELLGNEAYTSNGYDRKYVAKKVFNDKNLLQKLNNLIHPQVRIMAKKWIEKQENHNYCLYEAAIMNAANKGDIFDKIIVITSPLTLRIERIKTRDNRTTDEILAIISNQMSEEERIKMADYVIVNNETESLIRQVLVIDTQLKNN